MRIAMIPARLGSKRVPKKNLRFLGDKPLLAWVVETVRDSGIFDAVYVNSESDKILALAESLGVLCYRRDESLACDVATSEHFVLDFFGRVDCDEVFQVTPTSPFLTKQDLQCAVSLMDQGAHTVVSVKRAQTECLLEDRTPVNFDPYVGMLPSQGLDAVYLFCNGIFAWSRATFLESGCYGRLGRGVAMLPLEGASTIDIDSEEDFAQAEAVVARRRLGAIEPRYWSPTERHETDAAEVLSQDGVLDPRIAAPNCKVISLPALLDSFPMKSSAAQRVVETSSNCVTIISQQPNEGNRLHYHPDWDEWWLILEGEYDFYFDGSVRRVVPGDLVCIERNHWHQIIACGTTRATRLAVSRDQVAHVYRD